MSNFWSLETIGIKNIEDESASLTQSLTDNYISQREHRYVAKLPWKDSNTILSGSKEHAFFRLEKLIRRLSRNNQIMDYDAAIRQLIDENIAEPVPKGSIQVSKRIFYLPHRPVYKESSTTKVRVVFDASAATDISKSLNECLWTGTNLLPDILRVLLNFRLGPFGIVADIEEAFLQVLLDDADRDCHRFIWFSEKLNSVFHRPNFQDFRMTRVTLGVSCSPTNLCSS